MRNVAATGYRVSSLGDSHGKASEAYAHTGHAGAMYCIAGNGFTHFAPKTVKL
jgi:hypothetical protein